ncbi:unnamed protein product [Trifolium pratense]|uniref:Uncharacterized protein n=1 Tax=Trifolium pratense TaxID=57577 RepID=A0ACB0KSN0_TRIPR|nr:unnamed protein product [Trifolium pratense]
MCSIFSSFLVSFFPFSFENFSTPICNGIQKHYTFSSWQNNSINWCYWLPWKKVLELVNKLLCQYFQGMCLDLNRKINIVMRLVDLYLPYLFFNGIFDDMNTQRLLSAAKQEDVEMDLFYFDSQIIDWEDYFMNIHILGIFKYALK